MTKFLVLAHAPAEALAKMGTATPEEKEAGMKPWMAWKDDVGDKLLDFGSPLMAGTRISPGGKIEPSNNGVAGYMFIQANNKEEAIGLLKDHPHLKWADGCSFEIHEAMTM